MHDMKAIREDAERALRLCETTFSVALTRQQMQLLGSLAAFVRDITDETPLTVEALAREGFLKHGCYYCHKKIRATPYKDGSFDFVNSENNGMFYPQPRTVGDLRRLQYQLQRDGGK